MWYNVLHNGDFFMKKCNKCLEIKENDQFFKAKNTSDGLYSFCKLCKKQAVTNWRRVNKDKYNASMRAYGKIHRIRIHYKRQYGMELDDYWKLWDKQQGKCAICEQFQKGKRRLVVDHCHTSGIVRGLLCYGCNRGIAVLDKPELLQEAVKYLQNVKKPGY